MKLKKIFFTASSIAVGSSLLGSVLTSCSKATIDDKLKISLDDNGFLSNEKTQTNFRLAVKDALGRSSNWATFKAALADEIVYRWYEDRASEKKDSTTKNSTFRVNLDEWKNKIDKDYDETIKSLKNKYGDKYEFYLQNETLAPLGGTVEAYKHAKLVEKVRAEFISKVFATNYFGFSTLGDTTLPEGRKDYPSIYTPANISLSEDALKNPTNWKKLGFFARTNSSFIVDDSKSDIDANFLAKNPDGDYATIQSYVFDRWFDTEKPFFSAAALFKYSNPQFVADSKLSEIYNGVSTGAKIPDKPNEAFPFFGGYKTTESGKGTKAYVDWFNKLQKDGFETKYQVPGTTNWVTNNTISIPKTMTEDSQTLLLCFGSQMIGGSANALYIPYANAASSLYMQMITGDSTTYGLKNTVTQDYMKGNMPEVQQEGKDNFAILSNFFHNSATGAGYTLTSKLDLNDIYGGEVAGKNYHCPIFKNCETYQHFYGNDLTGASAVNGIRYITNAVQVELGKTGSAATEQQPWILELNEAGMHAQTIDGYQWVKKGADAPARKEALKEVVKYRLMQKKCGHNDAIISCDLFGESGKLKTYFTDNFTDIVLEMAIDGGKTYNVFRSVDSYANATIDVNTLFLNKISGEHKFSSYDNLAAYIRLTSEYDVAKKYLDAKENANSKTYAYRSKQIENSKAPKKAETTYENGLLAPIPYSIAATPVDSGISPKTYVTSDITIMKPDGSLYTGLNRAWLHTEITNIRNCAFVNESTSNNVNVNIENAFSPQIVKAKEKTSNRAWYFSAIVDKMMYQYMSNKEGQPNFIKTTAMYKYMEANEIGKTMHNDTGIPEIFYQPTYHAYVTTYLESKLFTNSRNYAYFGTKSDTANDLYTKLRAAFRSELEYKRDTTGDYCDDYLNYVTYWATMTYLYKNNWENFYKIINTKVSDDEMALVGYINKTNKHIVQDPTTINDPTKIWKDGTATVYDYTPDVNNIFDDAGYTGGTGSGTFNRKTASDQYWKVNSKTIKVNGTTDVTKDLAGFTGLQTKSSNQLDSASGLQKAAFDNFAKCSDATRDLNKITDAATEIRHTENEGCWFAFAGQKESNGSEITFKDVTYDGNTIKASDFATKKDALKIAKKMAQATTLEDLRSIAKKLGNAYYGDTLFKQIGDNTKIINKVDQLKYEMLAELKKDVYNNCFSRLSNIELHSEGSDSEGSKEYGFTDVATGNTYRILMTQLNKADIVEKRMTPTLNAGAFVYDNMPITADEFWGIVTNMAMDATTQQQAIADVVKTVYGADKLIVYDAQLYNCFDTVWIKDWSKKTIGA